MTNLSDAQLVVLSTASQRPDGNVFPITLKLKGNAIGNVLKSLIAKGCLEEVPGRADETIWRYAEDGSPLTLRATVLAYHVLGLQADVAPQAADVGETTAAEADTADKVETATVARTAAPLRQSRTGTKQAQLIEMLQSAEGATIPEIVAATGWQQHTVRGAISGALKKKLGFAIGSQKLEGRGRIYRID